MRIPARLTHFFEHVMFLALMLPTLILLAAAAVSLSRPDPSTSARIHTAMVCEPCQSLPADE
jgi:hypothetical protein